jgi:hypothetical protein
MFAARNMMFASAAFSPLSLSPDLWLDASDASTLYDATSGGSIVAADGAVARWEDKSGNARHATQSTGVYQPLRKTSIKNGLDIVRFDGSNDSLSNLSASLTVVPSTVFVVMVESSNVDFAGIFARTPTSGSDFDAASGSSILYTEPGVGLFGLYTNGAFSLNEPTAESIIPWSIISGLNANGDSRLYRNNPTTPKNSTSAALSATSSAGYLIAARFLGGAVDNSNYHLNGDVAEILVFPSALSDSNRQAVEAYLNAKWAIY